MKIKKSFFIVAVYILLLNSCANNQESSDTELTGSIKNLNGTVPINQSMDDLPAQEPKTSPVPESETFPVSGGQSFVSFAPTRLYAAATYALAMDENGWVTYLYVDEDSAYPDFTKYLCAGIVEDTSWPGIITQDLKRRIGGMTSKERYAMIGDSLLRGELVGAGPMSAVERLEQQEMWQDVCQMVSVWGDWYAALRTDGTVLSIGCFGSYEAQEEDWTDIVQIVSGGDSLFGLKADGTVCAHLHTNYMVYGKTCEEEIGEWSDIVQIVGGNLVTGLKKDGTVVTIRRGILGECQEWSGITKLAASQYSVVGIKEDGTLIAKCSEKCGFQAQELAGWKEIVDIAVCDEYCIAIGKDKTVYRTGQMQ